MLVFTLISSEFGIDMPNRLNVLNPEKFAKHVGPLCHCLLHQAIHQQAIHGVISQHASCFLVSKFATVGRRQVNRTRNPNFGSVCAKDDTVHAYLRHV
jgi:hypothetical protein